MTIGEKILNMRKARGWSQEELAERIGVTRQAVSRWESGAAKPDTDKVIAICDLFGVSADYLLRDNDSAGGAVFAPAAGPRHTTALGDAIRNMTLKQWCAWGMLVVSGLVLFTVKLIHVAKDTNYFYSDMYQTYGGFPAFLKTEGLELVWYLAMGGMVVGLCILLVPALRRALSGLWGKLGAFFHWNG